MLFRILFITFLGLGTSGFGTIEAIYRRRLGGYVYVVWSVWRGMRLRAALQLLHTSRTASVPS